MDVAMEVTLAAAGHDEEGEMGVRVENIFGGGGGGQPAKPGTYGEAPSGFQLPSGTRLGAVRLQISDLDRSLAYYQDVLGLRIVARTGARAVLAPHGDDEAIIELVESSGARPMTSRGRLGLFHYAILLPDRASLGRFLAHLEEIGVSAGAGDHYVSEALYLRDPDGLGIEVYADRPRSDWQRVGRQLVMGTDPLNSSALIEAARQSGGENPLAWHGMPGGTVIGHVHLHVGNLRQASEFYCDAMGFDRMVWNYPGALFFGAGGYHHHVGTNTWAGPEAVPPGADDAQLLEWSLLLPDDASLSALKESLARGGFATEAAEGTDAGEFLVRDPWGTAVRVRAR